MTCDDVYSVKYKLGKLKSEFIFLYGTYFYKSIRKYLLRNFNYVGILCSYPQGIFYSENYKNISGSVRVFYRFRCAWKKR